MPEPRYRMGALLFSFIDAISNQYLFLVWWQTFTTYDKAETHDKTRR